MARIHKRPFALYRKTDDFQYNAKCEKDGLETTQKEVPFCLVDTFSQQVALSVYPIP